MELECRQRNSSIPDVFEIYQTIVFKDSMPDPEPCSFTQTESGAIFDTGFPYEGNQRCLENFACSNVGEIVYFKFNRFETITNSDYFAIDLPTANQGRSGTELKYFQTIGVLNLENRLVLEGLQRTDVWVSAESIQDFSIYFYRNVHLN